MTVARQTMQDDRRKSRCRLHTVFSFPLSWPLYAPPADESHAPVTDNSTLETPADVPNGRPADEERTSESIDHDKRMDPFESPPEIEIHDGREFNAPLLHETNERAMYARWIKP